jgi:polyphosphate kinase
MESKTLFNHRDLSWIDFNERVLEEAADGENPILERLKFLAIFFNNYDEFFMVRVAGVKRLIDAEYNRKDRFGFFPVELDELIRKKTDVLIRRAYGRVWKTLREEMGKAGIRVKRHGDLNQEQLKFVKKYFEKTLFPIVTPIAVDQGRPLPALTSKSMAFAVRLESGSAPLFAVIMIPRNIPRLLQLPSEAKEYSFILIDEVLRHNLDRFFRGYRILDSGVFRVIRDSELSEVEEDEEDLLKAIESELKKRPNARVVRLEVEESLSGALLETLCRELEFPDAEASPVAGDLDLSCLFELVSAVPRPDLRFKSFLPAKLHYGDIFTKIRDDGPFILHVPYQSFTPTVDLLKAAARDESVLAIKMTLYRTNEGSGIIKALKEAAKNRKQVTALVEIKARFDEERNIRWVRELEEAGCHVMYGIAGMKIHSKIALIVRKEEQTIRRYVHLSTGNYNEKTATQYTDIGYFTANDDFARDISDVFNVITGFSVPSRWKRIISSPFDLRQYFFQLIDTEIEAQKRYGNGSIFAKMNSLEDTKMIEKLYEASRAGVRVRLIVRGICCLMPGVEGMSDTIEVRSIVGRFLEHSRVCVFNNNANPRVFLSSADWMTRNLSRRIELLFEVVLEELKEHLIYVMETYWKDEKKTRVLLADKGYVRAGSGAGAGEEGFNAQEFLIGRYAGGGM